MANFDWPFLHNRAAIWVLVVSTRNLRGKDRQTYAHALVLRLREIVIHDSLSVETGYKECLYSCSWGAIWPNKEVVGR